MTCTEEDKDHLEHLAYKVFVFSFLKKKKKAFHRLTAVSKVNSTDK